ncbi:hypothetical protein AAFC00_005959 [Neodothiora populina]|uniref:Transcription initiation factor IIF subunit alpha n=1 Tax=Neodothiora populina TaxID=2781224 RepID=A0ABR3P7U4_9PEZI
MSASPAGPPSGPASTTPNGGPVPFRRRKPTGPFAAKPKPVQRRPPGQVPSSAKDANGPKTGPGAAVAASASASASAAPPPTAAATANPDPDDDPSLYEEFSLLTTKKALLDGLRYHVMRFSSDREVNPYKTTGNQFQRPVRLQRRFPHDTPRQNIPDPATNEEDDKEREKEAVRKAERQAEREANQAQIAPTDKTAAAKKRQPFKKKTEDVYFPTDTPEAQKRAKLRYEEGRPWHLEDFTGKNTWVGTYEEPLSETHAMFVLGQKQEFRMVPLEKWYRFAPTARYQTMNLDEAETIMNKKVKTSRFMRETEERGLERQRAEAMRQEKLNNRGRVGERGERQRSAGFEDGEKMDVANDVDEIDFEADEEFQDDEENPLFAEDDEGKEAERKIKEERHGANIFAGVKEEKDWYEEEEREKREAAEERKKAKKTRKHLIKREKKYEYESESDHPYSESSESEDSEEERTKAEEERKKAEEAAKANGESIPSGATSKGTNTPSGRQEKHGDALRNKSSIANLKRPGSPNLSEASGSESTHKRVKKEHRSRNAGPSGSMSPNGLPTRNFAGSGSDTETSGNEKRIKRHQQHNKVMSGSPRDEANNGTPASSRSGTPGPVAEMPTADEVRAVVPPEGISIQNLIAIFKPRIPKRKDGSKDFVAIVKGVAHMRAGDQSGLLYLK